MLTNDQLRYEEEIHMWKLYGHCSTLYMDIIQLCIWTLFNSVYGHCSTLYMDIVQLCIWTLFNSVYETSYYYSLLTMIYK